MIKVVCKETISAHLQGSSDVKRLVAKECVSDIEKTAMLFASVLKNGGKLMFCGNGGSAADCQHLVAEFVSILRQDFVRPALAALALTTDTSFLTANANDFGFDGVFARQVEALGQVGDTLVGISTSGNSPNIIKAVQVSRSLGVNTVALTGIDGGKLADLVDISIKVPSENVQYIQEAHISIGHILCRLTEEVIFFEKFHKKDEV